LVSALFGESLTQNLLAEILLMAIFIDVLMGDEIFVMRLSVKWKNDLI
jgi:hypothetical protein